MHQNDIALEHSCVRYDSEVKFIYINQSNPVGNLGENLENTKGWMRRGQSALPPGRQWESQTQTIASRRKAAASAGARLAEEHHSHNPQSHRASSHATNGARGLALLIPGMVQPTRTNCPQQQCCRITLSGKPDWTDALITVQKQFLCSSKVIDTLLQSRIKLLPQSNLVLHLTTRKK